MNTDNNKIDQIAKEAFHNFEVELNPDDWELMEEKLDKKEHLMPYIWLYKGGEAALLLLLLLTGVHFLYQHTTIEHAKNNRLNPTHEVVKTPIAIAENISNVIVPETEVNMVNDSYKDNKIKKNRQSVKHPQKEGKLYYPDMPNAHFPSSKMKLLERKSFEKNQREPTVKKIYNAVSTNAEAVVFMNKDNTVFLEEENIAENKLNTEKKEEGATEQRVRIFSTDSIPVIDLKKTLKNYNRGGKKADEVVKLSNKFLYPTTHKPKTNLAVFVGADYSATISEGRSQFGMSFGVLLENELTKKVSVHYGLIATRKKFKHYTSKIIDSRIFESGIYTQTTERSTALSTLQFPVYLSATFYQNAKWELSASVGVAGQVLAMRTVEGTVRTSSQQEAGGLVHIMNIDPQAQEKALFQGGNPMSNIFVTTSLALDIERQLSPSFKLFLHPEYQYAINPVSAKSDRLSACSFWVGLKKNLD